MVKETLPVSDCVAKLQVIRLRNELEVKLSILALPMDICVQHAVRGNSALQGALTAALAVLGEIEALEDALRKEDINKVL